MRLLVTGPALKLFDQIYQVWPHASGNRVTVQRLFCNIGGLETTENAK